MRRFRFPLERALEVRELRRQIAEEKFGRCLNEQAKVEARLDVVRCRLANTEEEIRGSLRGPIDPNRVRDLRRFGSSLVNDMTGLARELQRQRQKTEKARDELVSSVRDEKVLKNYRTRLRASYDREYWWQQGKLLDEIGSVRYLKKKGGDNQSS